MASRGMRMNKIGLLFLLMVSLTTGPLTASGDDSTALANPTTKHSTASKVVDSKNHIVGTLLDASGHSAALVGFNGAFYLVDVSSEGFVDSANGVFGLFLFENGDCSGPASLMADPSSLYVTAAGSSSLVFATVSSGILYFPEQPIAQASFAAFAYGVTPADAVGNGCQAGPLSATAGLVGTFDLSRLGLKPPFKLK